MIDGIKPYPAYKPSGVPWLGDVPEHWEVERLKSRVINFVEQISDLEFNEPYIALEHVESWTGRLKQIETEAVFDSQVKRFYAGDVLFGRLRPYLAKVVRPNMDGVCVNEFFVLRPRGCNLRADYLERLLCSKPIIDAINSSTFGAKMPRADWQFVGNMQIPFPPLPEQQAIVRFLDYADRRIRRYIRAKQKLIKLLNEQKQAIIHRAVTRGLDPEVSLKPSGVEWLGEVPEHWVVKPLKRWVKINQKALSETTDPEYEFEYLDIGSVGTGYLLRQPITLKFGQAPSRARRIVQKGDTIISTVRTYLKAVYYISKETHNLVVSTGFAVLTSNPTVDPEYLSYVIQSNAFTDRVSAYSVGIAYPAIAESKLGMINIALPSSVDEQKQIVIKIKEEIAAIETGIKHFQSEIELLREYRTRLVADVVTGKLDVRGVKIPESEEAGEEEPALEMEEEMEETEEAEEVEADADD